MDHTEVRARVSLLPGGKAEVTFVREPALDYSFAVASGQGCDELRLERAIGYVRGVERAANLFENVAVAILGGRRA